MTARERLAPLAARLRAALADEKQRVNLLVCMGLAGLLLLAVSSWLPADSSTQSAAPFSIASLKRSGINLPSRSPAMLPATIAAELTMVPVKIIGCRLLSLFCIRRASG